MRRLAHLAGALYGTVSLTACVLITLPALLLWVLGLGGGLAYAALVLACRLVGSDAWTGAPAERAAAFQALADALDRLLP